MNIFMKNLYNLVRIYAKKYFTGHLGKVVEEDEKIICYVKKSKIKRKNHIYSISCSGIKDKETQLANAYKLNKPIFYVFDGLKFKKNKVFIKGDNNCEVIIKNCSFGLDLDVFIDGKCILDNTYINTLFYSIISANNLVIKKIDAITYKTYIEFYANDKINVIDSNIGNKKKNVKVSFIAANGLNITNSNIVGNEIECKSHRINSDKKSSLTAEDKVILKTDDFNPMNITAPKIVLNGEEIANEKESVIIKKITDPLTLKRLELVNLLKKVKTELENINLEKLSEFKEELSIQPISKVLKK